MKVYMPYDLQARDTGKGQFTRRLALQFMKMEVPITNRLSDPHDVALHLIEIKQYSSAKNVVRVDGVYHDQAVKWQERNQRIQHGLHSADGVIYQSHYSQALCDHYVGRPECPKVVILNGADPAFYQALPTAKSPFRYNFITYANWRPHKRLRDTILSFLKADIGDACLWIAGNINNSGLYPIEAAQYLARHDRIKYLGVLDQKALGSYLRMCDAMLHLCSHDACPNGAIEAVCSNTIVITNNVGGTQEIVMPSGGIICNIDPPYDFRLLNLSALPPIDHGEVAAAMKRAIRLRQEGWRAKTDHIDIRNVAAQYKAFLKSVVAKGRNRIRVKTSTVVGHLKPRYLNLTETFIYHYLSQAKRFKPLVMTDIALNLGLFPMACSYLIDQREIGDLRKRLGDRCEAFLEKFLTEMDYPNCFERLIREHKIGILHAHFGQAGYQALALKNRLGIPLITSFYGADASKWIAGGSKKLSPLFREGDLFLVLGEDMKQRLLAQGCPEKKIRIQHLGVDLRQIPFHRRQWPETGKRIRLLYCGRLVEKKGILYAIEAFAHLAEEWKMLELHIIGEGPLQPVAERAVRHLNLGDRIAFRGGMSNEKVLSEMAKAHLFLLPTITAENGDMEGTPTVLLEAQASGMPVVSTTHADIPEVVQNGKTGFLAPERDSRALANHLHGLLESPQTWPDMGRAGRRHVDHNYNIRRQVPKLEKVYAEWMDS